MNHLLLLISTSFNIIFLIITINLILKRGGLKYLYLKLLNIVNHKKNIIDYNNPPYYIHKQSQYKILPFQSTDIIFLGDSITDEGEWAELFQNNSIKNRGISGDTTERILRRLDSILAGKPKQIFLMVGINDLIMANKSVAATVTDYRQILERFHNYIPDTQVFIQSVLPVNNHVSLYWYENQVITDLNMQLKDLAKDFSSTYIDIFSHLVDSQQQLDVKYTSDGLHLNGDAYRVWQKVINLNSTDANGTLPIKFLN
jgi:lysophospholipase L1-like esterase